MAEHPEGNDAIEQRVVARGGPEQAGDVGPNATAVHLRRWVGLGLLYGHVRIYISQRNSSITLYRRPHVSKTCGLHKYTTGVAKIS